MPFGLTNALATFQALMNDILHDFIRVFVLVFYDIFIFSDSWRSHLQHVQEVMECLREHNLSIKKTKCSFGAESVTYLGHVISAQGVAMDADKVATVRAWPQLRTVRALCGFLGLT
jgi:hypothetical protein